MTQPGLATAHPMGGRLPAVYRDDGLVQRLATALDEVLAPVFTMLDCFSSYLDPRLAPEDMLEWLAGWVALALDDGWTPQQRRVLVANAVDLHRWQGTPHGLAAYVRLLTGGEVQVTDSGGCRWSAEPGGRLPGEPAPAVTITVQVGSAAQVDERRLRAVVAESLPAHLPVTVRVVGSEPPGPATGRARVPGSGP